ncbi:hypothetical protein NPIL_154531, partial [Nephila pilipes]
MRDSATVPINKEEVHVDPPLDTKVHLAQGLVCAIPTIEEQQHEKVDQVHHSDSETPSPDRDPITEVPLLSFDPKPKREGSANASKSPTILEMILEDPLSKDDILDSQEPPSTPINTLPSSPELEELQRKISPTGPPSARAFSKPTYAQKARLILEKCKYCEKKFYSKSACEKHIIDIHLSNPPSQPSHSTIDRSLKPSSQIQSSSEDFKTPPNVRKITIKDKPQLKKQQTSLFPVVPPYHFFCHICVDYFDTDITKAQHFKSYHNLLLKNISHKPKTSMVAISKASPHTQNKTETSVLKTKVSVPHVEDHRDLKLSVTDQALLAGPKVNDTSMTTPMLSRPSLQRKVLIPKPSEKKTRPANESTTTAVVHHEQQFHRVAPASVIWLCRLCSFEAINKNGLRLHYFRSHGHRTPPDDRFSPKSGLKGPTAASKKNTSMKNNTTNNPAVKLSNDDIEAIPSTGLEVSTLSSSQEPTRKKPAQSTSANRPSPPLPLQESRTYVNRKFSTLPVPPLTTPTHKTTSSTNNPSSTPEFHMPDRTNDPLYPYASFNQGTLRYCFPVPYQLKCPLTNCKSTFGTKAWYTTNTSIKKHLNTFHKAPPTT